MTASITITAASLRALKTTSLKHLAESLEKAFDLRREFDRMTSWEFDEIVGPGYKLGYVKLAAINRNRKSLLKKFENALPVLIHMGKHNLIFDICSIMNYVKAGSGANAILNKRGYTLRQENEHGLTEDEAELMKRHKFKNFIFRDLNRTVSSAETPPQKPATAPETPKKKAKRRRKQPEAQQSFSF